ncbi:MAG TPA: Ig-like domain-containing protein [Planctomycetaceae bacterium]
MALLALLCATASLRSAPPADAPGIRVLNDKSGRPFAFEAVGLAAEQLARLAKLDDAHERFSQLFAVHVVDKANDADLPAVAGSYSVEGSSLRFTPRFSLRPGMHYRAVVKAGEAGPGKTVTSDLTIPPAAPGKPTEVTQIYPSAGVLPENQLRFYIHFSGPMGRGETYEHVRLLDARGREMEAPFLEIGEELWDAGGRRLTIYIEPGRIKQGLKPREDLGPVLEAGRSYTLHVDRTWRDAAGQPLLAEFNKKFRTGPSVNGAIDPAEWKIKPPAAGSKGALVIKSPRPLDHALWLRTIVVANSADVELPGTVSVGDEERRWEFVPKSPWLAGKYQLVIDTILEDLAGNRIGQPFEVERLGTAEGRDRPATARLRFRISADHAGKD